MGQTRAIPDQFPRISPELVYNHRGSVPRVLAHPRDPLHRHSIATLPDRGDGVTQKAAGRITSEKACYRQFPPQSDFGSVLIVLIG